MPASPSVALSPLETMQTNAQRVLSLAWTTDSSTFAAGIGGLQKQNLLIGNPAKGEWTLQIETHANQVSQVAWSSDSATLAFAEGGAGRQQFGLLDVATSTLDITIANSAITSMTWSPGEKMITLGGENGTIVLWKLETEEIETTLDGGNNPVTCVTWSPDGAKLATAVEGNVILWNQQEDVYKRLLTIQNAGDGVAWSPDGSMLVTGGKHSGIWSAETGELLLKLASSVTPAWSPDGTLIAVNAGKNVAVLDARTGDVLFTAEKHTRTIRSLAWSPNGAMIVSGDDDGLVMVWGVKIIE
jgi:WD40 repeat protein